MATSKNQETAPMKNKVSFSAKFGLDPNRKKLEATDEGFFITRIVITPSKKKYSGENPETGEQEVKKIDIAQIDVVTATGDKKLFYSPNVAIVEACKSILADSDFAVDGEGILRNPCEISRVKEGGTGTRKYIAFE